MAGFEVTTEDLLLAKNELRLSRAIRKLAYYEALVIDDLGYVQQSRDEMEVLFTLLSERYERGSVLISSNLPFSKWEAVFKDPMTTAAAIDRLVHHSVRDPRAEYPELPGGGSEEEKGGRGMRAASIRKSAFRELEAPPPDLRDLPRSCHPRSPGQSQSKAQSQNPRAADAARLVWPRSRRSGCIPAEPYPPPRSGTA